MRRKTDLPKGVWFQRKRLATGEVIRYGYFGRGPGMEALGREGSAAFHERLAEVLKRVPEEGRVAFLIWRFKNSTEFAKLRPLTRRDYNRQLDKIQEKFGKLRLSAISAPEVSDHLYRWRDKMAETSPRQADYAVSVLAAMLAWSVRRGLINHNRAAGIPDVYVSDRREKVWTPEMETAVLKVAPAPIQRAIILAAETGISQEDLLVLPKSAVVGNVIVLTRRLKTGTPAAIPISPRLAEMLATIPASDSITLLNKADGRPFDPKGNGLRSLFRAARDAAGVTDRTFNDLRGTFITRRRVMGWTAEEAALCSGHPIAGERGAQGAYVDRAAVALASANRLWDRFYGPNSERKLQTGLQTGSPAERLSH